MSEEEIIKEIKQTLETWQHIIDFGYGTIEVPNETKIFKTILNLIDKQQKEIETLKEVDKKICNEELLVKDYVIKNYISKDKIRHILLKFQNEYGEDLETTDRLFIGKEVVQYGEDMIDEIAKELDIKLLEEE